MLSKNGLYSQPTSSSSSLISLELIHGKLLPRITKYKWKNAWKKLTKTKDEEDELSDRFSSSTHSLVSHDSISTISQASSKPPQLDDLTPLEPICIEPTSTPNESRTTIIETSEITTGDETKSMSQKPSRMFSITSFDKMIMNGFESTDPEIVNFTIKLSLTPELAR